MPVGYLNSNPWQKLNDLFAISRHFISLRMKAIRLAASTGRKVFSFRTRNKQQEEERNNGRKRTSRNTCPAGGSGLGAYPLPKNSRKTPENSRKKDKNSRKTPLSGQNSTENSRKLYGDGNSSPSPFLLPYLCIVTAGKSDEERKKKSYESVKKVKDYEIKGKSKNGVGEEGRRLK